MNIDRNFFDNLKEDYAGFFDYSREENNILIIGGWSILFSENNILPHTIYILYNNTLIAESNLFSVERPDVQEVNGSDIPLVCGFEISIPNKYKSKLDSLEVFVGLEKKLYHLSRFTGLLSQVELIGKCNLRCPQCPSVIYSDFHNKSLDRNDIDLIKPLFEQARNLCFDGFGEVLLSKEIEYALQSVPYSKNLIFHTNGMLLNRHYDLILKYAPPLRHIIVSIDSLNNKLYSIIRRLGNLDKVLNNTKTLFNLRNERKLKYPKIIPNMIIMKSNFHEIKDFIDLASSLDSILELIHLYDIDKLDSSDFDYENEKIKYSIDEYNEVLNEALEYAKKKNVHVYFSGSVTSEESVSKLSTSYIGERKSIKDCHYKDKGRCIQADGKYMFCVWQTSPVFDWKATNNIDPQKNERALKVMDMLNKGEIPFECSGAGCQYIHEKISKESKPNSEVMNLKKGGWSSVK